MYNARFDYADFIHGRVEDNYETHARAADGPPQNIYRPNKKLKAYHTFLNLFIFEYLPINERTVYSYRKGFSVYHAVTKHSDSKYFYQTDISAFFASIDRSLIKRTILLGLASVPAADVENSIERILDLVCIEDSLPIGLPSSAPLSNAALYAFDNEFEKCCEEKGLIYTRYSDDIIVSGNSKDALNEIDQDIQTRLISCVSEKLKLNPAKSKRFQIGGKVKILGLMILPGGKVTIDSKLKSEIEILLHFYTTDKVKFRDYIEIDEQSAVGRITGFLNYANSIDPEYLSKLRRKFGATIIDTIMHRPLAKS